jgi:hypothetical protein
LITSYFKYLLRSGNEHAIHSPFLFDLYTKVIKVKNDNHPDYNDLKLLRKALLSSNEEIEILDLGAGSRVNKSNLRKIKTIAKTQKSLSDSENFFTGLSVTFNLKPCSNWAHH